MSEEMTAENKDKKISIAKCPNVECEDTIKYEAMENGNYWVGCDSCCYHSQLPNILRNEFDLLTVKNKSLQDIIENQQKEIKALEDAATVALIEEDDNDFDPDEWARNEESRRSEQA